MGICGSVIAADVWGKHLVHDQPEPNHPDIYHTPSGKDIICFHIHSDQHAAKTIKQVFPQTCSSLNSVSDASTSASHSTHNPNHPHLSAKTSSSLIGTPQCTESYLQLDLNRYWSNVPEHGRHLVNSPVSMCSKRESFETAATIPSSYDKLRANSSCSSHRSEASEPSRSATCFDLLHGSYKTVHEYMISSRPFGMRIVDGKVTLVKGAASKAGIRPGDELQKINKFPVCSKTWADKFAHIDVPFTITLLRFHCGSAACSTSPSQGYDTETGMVRMTPQMSRVPEKGGALNTDYSPYNIVAGRISRHLSPNKTNVLVDVLDEAPQKTPKSSESNSATDNVTDRIKETPNSSGKAPKVELPSFYVPDSIYAGRLCRQKSPHKTKQDKDTWDKDTPKALGELLTDYAKEPPKPKSIVPQEAPSHLSDMLSDITLT